MQKPWYKQFWPWFLIALPTSAVIGSFITLSIFADNQVNLVAEDYYKKGKAINLDLSRLKVADELALKAKVRVDKGEVRLSFDKGELPTYPSLRITFTHRTLADKDFSQMVSADANGNYRFTHDQEITGPWFVQVEPFDGQWTLQGKVALPTSDPVPLYGQSKE